MIHLTLPYAKTKPTLIIQHHCATGKPNDPPNFTVCQNPIPIPILGKSNPAVQPEKQMIHLTLLYAKTKQTLAKSSNTTYLCKRKTK